MQTGINLQLVAVRMPVLHSVELVVLYLSLILIYWDD